MTTTTIGPFDFIAAGRLWGLLLLPLLIAAYIIALHLSSRKGIRYTNTGILAAVLPKQSQWRRHVSVAMALASLAMICGAWARPVGVEKQPRERATVVLILDASLSMEANDVKPTRLDAEKEAAIAFVRQLPLKYNVSIVKLTGSPASISPPTTDRTATIAAINSLELDAGTAIGSSIQAAVSAIDAAPLGENDTPAPGLILLLSDGSNTVGPSPISAAAAAKEKGYRVFTIAFGTQNGYVDLDGKRENVAPDAQALREIATAGNGRALSADSVSELNDVYQELSSDVGYEDVKTEVTATWALYALAFAIVAALGVVSMAARWP
ncbi:MAG: VWA domain-containing protein [Propionibacteriaceae bacterium]|nr:VWA domain-containing protein [Propionibacteriaceae bacterium]